MSPWRSEEFQTPLTNQQINILSVLYVSSLSLSLVGSFSVVVVSLLKRRILKEQAKLLFQLALADSLAAAVLLCTSAMNFVPPEKLPREAGLCKLGLPLSMTFYCVSFLLVMVYAYETNRTINGWRERSGDGEDRQLLCWRKEAFVPLCIVAWCVPFAPYFVYVISVRLIPAGANDGGCSNCTMFCTSCILLLRVRNDTRPHVDWWHNIFVRCFFFTSVLLVIICCAVVYHKVGRWYQAYEERGMFLVEGDGFSRRQLRGLRFTIRSMVMVGALCWTPAFILVALSFMDTISNEQLFPLYVIQALTVSLQGFLNSLVYGWLRGNFRRAALRESVPLLAKQSKAFYDESLTTTD